MKRLALAFGNFMTGVHEFINEQIYSGNRRETIRDDDVDMSFNIHSRQDEIETLPLYFDDDHWICFFRRVLVDDEDPISATFIDEIKSKRIDWPETRSGFVYPTNVQHRSDDESEDTEDEGGINILQHGDDIKTLEEMVTTHQLRMWCQMRRINIGFAVTLVMKKVRTQKTKGNKYFAA